MGTTGHECYEMEHTHGGDEMKNTRVSKLAAEAPLKRVGENRAGSTPASGTK